MHGSNSTYNHINITLATQNGVVGFLFSNGKTFVAVTINLVLVGESISSTGCYHGTVAGQSIVTTVSAIKNPNSYRIKLDMTEVPNAFDVIFLVGAIGDVDITFSEA